MSRTYEEEANNLAQAVDIAIEAFQKYPPENFTPEHVQHAITVYLSFKESALHPEPQFKRAASLKYVVADVFTFFNEGAGEAVSYFWSEIGKKNLPYKRKDHLQKILTRKKIVNRIEYHYVVDTIVPLQQEGRIDENEARLLGQLVDDFEKRNSKR